jgi:hypothetical protein
VRRLPATTCSETLATRTGFDQLAPPLVERMEMICVSKAFAEGTITVPLACTSGCPPRPIALLAVAIGGPHVRPPSVDLLASRRLPWPLSSHVV